MISIFGNYLLILSMILGLAVFIAPKKLIAYCYYFSSSLLIISFLLLLISFINLDFSLQNVFLNSSINKPLIYRLAGSWASHEGSMLLFIAMLGGVGLHFAIVTRAEILTRSTTLSLLSFIQILLTSFVFFISNPFSTFEFVPKEGLGLNPVLQDIALSIHPPLLYLGYVTYHVPFVAAIIILLQPDSKYLFFKIIKDYTTFALAALTLGIGLGSWWAYRELGWGGFWFFDPVENISLMPWLLGIALHHFLLITVKNGTYERTSLFLALSCFLVVILGIFLVRSGIVSSVHSFAFSPERGIYIISIFLILSITGFTLYKFKNNYFKNNQHSSLKNRVIIIGSIFWLISFGSIFIAVIYPIYFSYIFGSDISIDPEYFYKIFIPLMIPIMLLAAIGPNIPKLLLVSWQKISLYLSSIALFIACKFYFEFSMIISLTCAASSLLMLYMIDYIITASENFHKKLTVNQLALFLGHFGFGMLALSMALNVALSQEIKFSGEIGETINLADFEVKLHDIKFAESEVYYRQIAEFWIKTGNDNLIILKPENRLYKTENSLSQEADIFSFLTHDLYAVLSKIEGNIINAEIYYRPFIGFIWLSALIIFFGFFILIFRKNN